MWGNENNFEKSRAYAVAFDWLFGWLVMSFSFTKGKAIREGYGDDGNPGVERLIVDYKRAGNEEAGV